MKVTGTCKSSLRSSIQAVPSLMAKLLNVDMTLFLHVSSSSHQVPPIP
jgi:hypothetical protein